MKLDEKYTVEEQIKRQQTTSKRWKWVRRFTLFTFLVGLSIHTLYPVVQQDNVFITIQETKARVILHTGFPPVEHISGLSIQPGKAAATAFSPNPTNFKEIGMDRSYHRTGESWWDRLFPNRHVHLVSVQIPVSSPTQHNRIEGTLSICASKRHGMFGNIQVPDLNKCVQTVSVNNHQDEVTEDDLFGVLEWVPEEEVVVLKKSKLYWLVVQSDKEAFDWVYAEGGSNQYGTAYETEAGWELKLEGEPVPSAMIMVKDHSK
ncbi:uncharacterized protein B0P05DRAFT_563197 [Gilbertella persicaria]|uniref:uncharacterized protein n=1 Tax=Gilbertella persicaria TaxID=101096 RepID=UPI00221FBE6A|nr:uncharacterized protein B0P05DRAFT_563197 [Gilbertella persicaria]KAI8050127.1 hypothetical protein B0P05DRAFT_563197 [Gilbertella persicaria]